MKLIGKIQSFLKKKIKIERGYERAKADPKDLEELAIIIRELLGAKWEPSYDGYVPIEVLIINRSTHEAFYYLPQPYDQSDEKQLNFEEKMRIATMNVAHAAKDLERVWRVQELNIRMQKAKKENRYCTLHGDYKTPGHCPECFQEARARRRVEGPA